MYPVTNEFKLAAKQPVQEHRLYGTIGSVSFDKSNIIQGSFHITNQCTDTNDVVLGSVYTGTLTATFTGLSIPRYAWIGKRITVYFGLKITPTTWEDIPMGIFTVKEAKHSAEGVSVTAYDDMIKLDKKFKKSKFKEPAKIYNFLTTICNTCGLILEDSEQTIQSRPNGNTLLGIVGTASNSKLKKYANDLETYRDLVFWIAQSMACFATINKLGHLTFVPYKNENNVVDEITETHRIAGAVFDDFTTNYTGIYVTNTADGEEIYYGYDEQELEQEIATVEGDIQDVEIALDQLAQQYQQGQITEAEYKRQKKVLDKQLKNLDKRLAWLNEALNKAQSEEDGLYMDLGENPMMQADGVGNTPTTMRKRILKALDAISYTPFTCDTVCGAHYDLGDIIRFTGGHATELGEVCCVMAYDFNMNGEYRMQGFGSDPSKGVMKSKNSKKADKANRNADNSAKNTTGPNTPTSGNEGDLYIKTGENLTVDSIYPGSGMYIDTQSGDANTGYTVTAHCRDDVSSESIHFAFTNLTVGQTYTLSCAIQITEMMGDWGSHNFCLCVRTQDDLAGASIPVTPGGTVTELSNGVAVTLYYDEQEHSYQITFTASASTYYVIVDISFLHNTWYGTTCPTTVSNLKISEGDTPTEGGTPEGIKVYTNDQWKNLDYVKKVKQVQTSSGGTKIATAKNSDGSSTDIYAPTIPVEDVKVDGTSVVTSKVANINTMTGATASAAGEKGLVPAPASGDEGKFLRGDGTWQNAGGGSDGYAPTDATEATIADDDKMPFYDTSASGKRNSTWANIKSKLKAYFDTIYSTFSGNFNDLSNRPSVNGITLSGNKKSSDLKIAYSMTETDYASATKDAESIYCLRASNTTATETESYSNITWSVAQSGYTAMISYTPSAANVTDITSVTCDTNTITIGDVQFSNGAVTALLACSNPSNVPSTVTFTFVMSKIGATRIVKDGIEYGRSDDTGYIPLSQKGAANGVASLANDGKVPSAQLPTIPTKTSDLTNDSGFVTADEIVEETDTANSAPYLYRPSQSNGDRLYEKLVGASFGVNQIYNASSSTSATIKDVTISNSSGTVSITGTSNGSGTGPYFNWTGWSNYPQNHVVLFLADFTLPSGCYIMNQYDSATVGIRLVGSVWKASATGQFLPQLYIGSSGQQFSISNKHLSLIDLTAMFGTDIADKAYTMEQATAGSGIAWLKSYGFFTEDYYPYNAGSLVSVKPTGKVNVGFNQWDEEWEVGAYSNADGTKVTYATHIRSKEYIPCFPNTTYYYAYKGNASGAKLRICYYDENKVFIGSKNNADWNLSYATPSGAMYLNFCFISTTITFYENDVCINLSKPTGTPKNGDYVPYTEYTYPITTELRGVAKLVGNDIVYDGDVDDGKNVQRKYGIVNLGTLDWTYSSSVPRFGSSGIANLINKTGTTTGLFCPMYTPNPFPVQGGSPVKDKTIAKWTSGSIFITNTDYTDATAFKNAMSGVYLVYELATPTTEPSNGFTMPQIVDKNGTEKFNDNRTVPIPVGHDTEYVDLPNWMEQGYYKDFRDRVDYPEDSGEYVKNESLVGNYQAITGFDSPSNCFITPTDGYIIFSVPSTTTDKFISVYFMIGDYTNPFVWLNKTVGGNGSFAFEDAMFVKKDTKCYVYSNTASATLSFFS